MMKNKQYKTVFYMFTKCPYRQFNFNYHLSVNHQKLLSKKEEKMF